MAVWNRAEPAWDKDEVFSGLDDVAVDVFGAGVPGTASSKPKSLHVVTNFTYAVEALYER